MLIANNISFSYPNQEKKVLDGLSVTITEGVFTCILGHNGSGKSTLARMFNALLMPTDGDVTVDGILTSNQEQLWEIRRQVGMVFQNPDNQLVATTVEEDVAFGPENLGIAPLEIRKRVNAALQKVNMQAFSKKAPHQLSGGQKQRVAIAGILAMQPRYIFFDEATAMLDPIGRREVIDTIRDLRDTKTVTPILITHFMEEAALADRIIVMAKGKIVLDGSPKEVLLEAERLKSLKLNVPAPVEIADYLRKSGIQISKAILTKEDLVEELCRLR